MPVPYINLLSSVEETEEIMKNSVGVRCKSFQIQLGKIGTNCTK
jgi:hypothetical protein